MRYCHQATGNKATADFVITVTVPKNYKLAPDAD